MFSNIGEHVRRLSPLASGAALHAGLSQERSRGLSPVEGISGSGTSGALTCPGGNGLTRLEKGCSGSLGSSRRERCQRDRSDGAAASR